MEINCLVTEFLIPEPRTTHSLQHPLTTNINITSE